MKKIKMLLIAVLALCVCFSIFACSKSSGGKNSSSSSQSNSSISSSESSQQSSASLESGSSENSSSLSSTTTSSSSSSSSSTSVAPIEYTISIVNSTGGRVVSNKQKAIVGESVTLTITTSATYYTIKWVKVNGTVQTINENEVEFIMPEQNVEVTYAFNDTREYVSHLVFGDSYTYHQLYFRNFYTDMQDLPAPKILGIGGTTAPQWGLTGTAEFQVKDIEGVPFTGQGGLDGEITQYGVTRTVDIINKYNVDNFVFHIGSNDINYGNSPEAVFHDLQILFSQYHEAYPDAHIYWVSCSMLSNTPYRDGLKQVNLYMTAYAGQTDYLTYINTVDTMYPDGETRGDWCMHDGLHMNADGYNTWSSLVLEALGYPRKDIGSAFGSAGQYYSSNNWTESDGIVSNSFDIPMNNTDISLEEWVGNPMPFYEQHLWFKDVLAVDMYAEMEVTVNSVAFNDPWPKFGMGLKGEGTHMFFFVEALGNLTGTATSFTERKMSWHPYGYMACNAGVEEGRPDGWDWSIQKYGKNITGSFSNGQYIKIALLRTGTEMYFIVNNQVVLDLSGREYTDGKMAIGFTSSALNVSIKNYSVTTDISAKLQELGIDNGGTAYFEGNKDTLDVTASGIAAIESVNTSSFYFETNMQVNGPLNADPYPKFGLLLGASNGESLFFFVSADDTKETPFGTVKNVGFVRFTSNAGWDWANAIVVTVPSLNYGNGEVVKMAIYKDGSKIIGLINGVAVLEISQYEGLAGDVRVGFMGFSVDADLSDAKIATSDKILNIISDKYNLTNDKT